jgi:hypothetical protein
MGLYEAGSTLSGNVITQSPSGNGQELERKVVRRATVILVLSTM